MLNKVVLMGRLTRDPEIRVAENTNRTKIARYTLAVNRRWSRDGDQNADFIPCVVFGKSADFVENYLKRGMKVAVSGRIQTGSYINKDGNTVYTTDVVVDEHEFAESKGNSGISDAYESISKQKTSDIETDENGFIKVDEKMVADLPFM